jgi:2-haloacid dehalogenase
MPRLCLFDVNETLLDLAALDSHFARVFGDAAVRTSWFLQMLQSAMVATIAGPYADFSKLGGAALDMVAERYGVTVSAEDRQQILSTVPKLPPHPEVRESLERLHGAGFRMAALTNSTEKVATAQLTNAGLADLFEKMISADTVQRLKPAPEPYHYAAEQLGMEIGQIRMVAAHAWDIAGAIRAGCAGAFVARPGKVLDPLYERPDVVGANMRAVVDQIIQVEQS